MRVFISCAWENDEYRDLVKGLAACLRDDGIDARLDAWHLERLTILGFMSREVLGCFIVITDIFLETGAVISATPFLAGPH
jgi:SEFIR domain